MPQHKSRKVFLIAHKCNDIKKVKKAFRQGANGIECDLRTADGKWLISHDGISGEDLVPWLIKISKLIKSNDNRISIIIFDIKKAESIIDLIQLIHNSIPDNVTCIYSVPKIDNAKVFISAYKHLNKNEMFSIDAENNPEEVSIFFKENKIDRCCYGNGITDALLDAETHHESLSKAGKMRDNDQSFVITYAWTVYLTKTMKRFLLQDNVDGIIVNLNGFLKRPIRNAMKIIRRNNLQLAKPRNKIFF